MIQFRKQNFFSNGPNLLGMILFLAGLVAFGTLLFLNQTDVQKTIWVGLIACIIGIVLMTISSGIAIDFKTYQYRSYESILGVTFGEWKKLPPIQKIDLIQHSYTSQNTPNGITPTFSSKHLIHKIVLISAEQVELTIDFRQEKKAIVAGEKLQKLLRK